MSPSTYRTCLLAFFLLTALSISAERLNFYGRDAATIGVYITDLSTEKVIEKENINKAMIPASILKSVTSATALNLLGENFRYNTDVMLQGEVQGDVLNGNIVIKASGDPTIESSYFTDRKGFDDMIIEALKARNISTVKGEIIVDEAKFKDVGQCPQWVVEDTGWDYGAGYYGFNYKNNIFKLYTASLKTIPHVPYIDVVVNRTNSSTDIQRGTNSNFYIVSGRNVDNAKFYVTTTMNSPSVVFVHNMRNRLQSHGIIVEDKIIENCTSESLLFRYQSPKIIDILRVMMFKSDNMMAEATLRAFAPGQSRNAAIKKELAFWKNVGVETNFIKIADGSGLARVDRVTPDFMLQVLKYMAKSPFSDTFVGLFPKVGRDGTVENFLRNTALDGKLALKSGSMNGVHCYAGYKLDSNGTPTHAIVIIVNNFFCSRNSLRKEIQRYLISVFK